MYAACSLGDLRGVKRCIEILRLDPNGPLLPDARKGTPLDVATRFGHLEIVKYLAYLGNCNVNATNTDNFTALHAASYWGHLSIVKFLIEEKRCNSMVRGGKYGKTPLHLACTEGHIGVVKYLVNRLGVDPSCTDKEGLTPLYLAGTVEIARFLVEKKGCDANSRSNSNRTPLHWACDRGCLDVVKYLVNEREVSPYCADNEGSTPLHLAKTVEIARFLVEEKVCDANSRDDINRTPLHWACDQGCLDVVKYLVNEQEVSPYCTDDEGSTPLHLAKTVEIARFLVEEKGCDANSRNNINRTPLHWACDRGCLDVVKYLVNEQEVSPYCTDNNGCTPLHLAKTVEIARFLVEEKGCDANSRNNSNRTPLHCACDRGCLDVVKYLVNEQEVTPSCTDNIGCTPLHLAKTVEIARFLVEEKGCDANSRSNINRTPLHCACISGNGRLDVVKYLVNEQEVTPSCTDNNGCTPLHLAKTVEIARFLVEEKQCDPDIKNRWGNTPLTEAAKNVKLDLFQYLIFSGCCNVTVVGNDGWTALHAACKHSLLNVTQYLMNEINVNPCCKDSSGNIPLRYVTDIDFAKKNIQSFYSRTGITALSQNDLRIFAKEIAHKFPNHLVAALSLACKQGHLQAVKSLILEGANPLSQDADGNISLHIATSEDFIDIVQYLINEQQVDASCRDGNASVPLHHVKSVKLAKFLVEGRHYDINIRDNFNNTPLLKAALHGRLSVFRYLVFCGHCDVVVTAENGWTPLHTACKHGFLDVVNYVINTLKVDVENDGSALLQAESENGWTPLHIACQQGHTPIMLCLLKETNINPCRRDFLGKKPLHYVRNADEANAFICASYSALGIGTSSQGDLYALAKEVRYRFPNLLAVALSVVCKRGHVEAVKSLVLEGANPSHQDPNGNTSLHIAATAGHSDIVDYLIGRKCYSTIRNIKGNTAVHMASENGHLQAVRSLYNSRDCVPECRGEKNRTPLHVACKSGQIEIVKYMLDEQGLNPSSEDKDGNTPLHLAAQSGWLNIIQFIVENDGDYEQGTLKFKNHMDRTPMQEACANSHFHVASYLISHADPKLRPVHAVSKSGQLEVLKYILNDGQGSLDEHDEEGNTSLHYAAQSDNIEMMKYIISTKKEYRYSLNKFGHTPIQMAVKCACLNVVRYMLQDPTWCMDATKDTAESSLMHVACHAGHLDVLKCLIREFHFNPDSKDEEGRVSLFSAAAAGRFKIIEYLIENQCDPSIISKSGDTPLHIASLRGHTNIVLYLLSRHCKPDDDDDEFSWSALHAACQGGHLKVARILVINADVNPFCLDKSGNIPLHYAASSGNLQLVKYLTEGRECLKNPKNNQNNTPLHNAAVSGHLSIVKHLIESGNCTPEDRGCFEQTALHYACQGGHFEIVKYLLEERKVDATLLDDRGCSALDMAAGYDDIITYLSGYLQSSEQPPAKKPRLDTESVHTEDQLASSDDTNAEYGISTNQEDELGTPAKRLKLSSTMKRDHRYKNVSWMPRRDSAGDVRKQLLPFTKKRAQAGQELGFGSYGRVVEVRIADNPKIYAGKIFKPSDCTEFHKALCSEFTILSQLKHPNIVSYYGICSLPEAEVPVLLMERLDTNLHDYLCNKDNENAKLPMKLSILLDVVNGLVYLHCQIPVIIHRDLTARNVLLDKYLNAKISDFGNARMMTYGYDMTPQSMTSLPGTRDYMPPEAMDNVDEICYDTKLDVFSFGHLVLFCGIQRPIIPLYQTYYDSSNEFCYRSELERRDRYMTELKSNLGDSHALIHLIIQCLDDDPDERPSTETLRAQMKCLAPVKELGSRYMNDIYGYLHLLPKPDMLQLGLVLGLNYSKLTGKLDTSLFHQEVIAAWLRKEDYVKDDEKRRPTWANLVAALRNDTVRQNGIANLIYQHEGLKFFI